MERPRAARSAKWGEACAPCAAAKTRCIRSRKPSGVKCDRCQSLEKNCSNQVQGPRKKRQAKSSKTAQLEEKLNELIETLKASAEEESPASSNTLASSDKGHPGNSRPSSSPGTEPQVQDRLSQGESVVYPPAPSSGFNAPPTCTCRAPVSKADLEPLESDEALLSIYVNQLSSQFPFVIIPPGTTPKQLQKTRPFLMKVIRMVASVRNLQSMWGQSHAVIKYICDAMLLRSERSLDLLQGILVFLGFYHYFCMAHAHFNNLAHLLVSLVRDLDLTTHPNLRLREKHHRLVLGRAEELRTNEERRVLLGVWYMSSNAALIVGQLGSVRYTKYLEQCVNELETCMEYETDQLAVQLVRIQHLTEKILDFHTRDQLVDDLPGLPKASALVCLEAFQTELDRLKNALPPKLKSNHLLSCHLKGAYLRLFAPFLAEAHLVDAIPQPLVSLSLSGLSPLDILSRFTAALKAWFEDWFAVPVCSYFYMSQPASSQFIQAARYLVLWTRLSGPSAVMFSSTGTITTSSSQKEASTPCHLLPTFIGVSPLPGLGVPGLPASTSDSDNSAQKALDMLRAEVFARPELRVDVLHIIDAVAVRLEAAKKEMSAAQGGLWKNDMWDSAAEQMRGKRAMIEKWCESAAAGGDDRENQPLVLFQGGGEVMNTVTGWNTNRLESGDGQESWQWGSDLFDGMDLDLGAFFGVSGDWGTDGMDNMG